MNLASTDRYKSTELYTTLREAKLIEKSMPFEEARFMENYKLTGNTWDARHLDNFLNTNAQATGTAINRSRSITPGRKLTHQGSHFFKPGPRFQPDREFAYVFNITKDFSVKEAKDNVNSLLFLSKVSEDTLKKYYDKNYQLLPKNFDETKLDFTKQPNRFMTPIERRAQLEQTRKEQDAFQAWRKRYQEVAKKTRIYKNAYKSGVVALDNPIYDHTLMYSEEKERLDSLQRHKKQIEARRLAQLKDLHKTSDSVEFFNPRFDPSTTQPPKKIIEHNGKVPVRTLYTESWKNTHERIFKSENIHIEKYNVKRAEFLKEKDTNGRNWNPITTATNFVDINKIVSPNLTRRGTLS